MKKLDFDNLFTIETMHARGGMKCAIYADDDEKLYHLVMHFEGNKKYRIVATVAQAKSQLEYLQIERDRLTERWY